MTRITLAWPHLAASVSATAPVSSAFASALAPARSKAATARGRPAMAAAPSAVSSRGGAAERVDQSGSPPKECNKSMSKAFEAWCASSAAKTAVASGDSRSVDGHDGPAAASTSAPSSKGGQAPEAISRGVYPRASACSASAPRRSKSAAASPRRAAPPTKKAAAATTRRGDSRSSSSEELTSAPASKSSSARLRGGASARAAGGTGSIRLPDLAAAKSGASPYASVLFASAPASTSLCAARACPRRQATIKAVGAPSLSPAGSSTS
mmetsp:Transcript_18988/g.65260  ORF Transcript_18988/g.65260 Transcript_18988/m.65260 type:complete len:267 (-) Transcript_18988:2729-3529(-)